MLLWTALSRLVASVCFGLCVWSVFAARFHNDWDFVPEGQAEAGACVGHQKICQVEHSILNGATAFGIYLNEDISRMFPAPISHNQCSPAPRPLISPLDCRALDLSEFIVYLSYYAILICVFGRILLDALHSVAPRMAAVLCPASAVRWPVSIIMVYAIRSTRDTQGHVLLPGGG